MKRATLTERAERVAAAKVLCREHSAAEAARMLAARFDLSRVQASRYVRAAREADSSLARAEATAPLSVRIPVALLARARARARHTGVSLGALVARALARLLDSDSP